MACNGCNVSLRSYYVDIWHDKEKQKDFLLKHGLIRSDRQCDSCNSNMRLSWDREKLVWVCGRSTKGVRCRKVVSARLGTWFGDSKLSISTIIEFCIFWLTCGYPRQDIIITNLQLSSSTVVNWSSFCREVCENYVITNSQKIGGVSVIVEMNEVKFKNQKHNHDCQAEDNWVFGAVERDNKSKFVFLPVDTRDKGTLLSLIQQWILPGTTIISDCWRTYDCLNDEGYKQLAVNQSLKFVCTATSSHFHDKNVKSGGEEEVSVHTHNVERKWRNVQYTIPMFGRKNKNFHGYLAEHIFKANFPLRQRVHAFFLEAAKLYSPR